MAIYKGFSTIGKSKKFRLTDLELVKRDLLNHFSIRRGEKLMNPSFGSLTWDSLFEPLNDTVKEKISDDVKQIIAYEIRVKVNNIVITQYEFGLQLELDLTYIPTNQVDKLILRFERDSNRVFRVIP